MTTRSQLVDAAKDLNEVLNLSPQIDVKQGVDQLKKLVAEASELLREDDKIKTETRAVIDELTGKAPADAAEKAEDGEVQTKEKPAKVKAEKAPKVKAEKPKSDGTRRRYADASVITLAVSENPKQNGSAAHARFALYRDGMTCAEFIAAGGSRSDLSWDAGHNFIKVAPTAA